MSSPILVTGGTGTLGKLVLPRLRAAGAEDLRVLSRHPRTPDDGITYQTGDLRQDHGIAAALDGVETVLHLAGAAKGDDIVAANLVRTARAAGVRHLVYVSVIAADRVPIGYMRNKAAAERTIADSGIPFTTLRAAQFHQLVIKAARAMAKSPVVPMPGGIRWQPVDADEVAARLVELTLGEPSGRVRDLAGPEVLALRDMVSDWLRASGRHRLRIPVRVPGRLGKVYRAGGNLNLADAETGKRTWKQFLAEQA